MLHASARSRERSRPAPLGFVAVLSVAAVITVIVACGTKAPVPADQRTAAHSLDSLRAEVRQLVAEPACDDANQFRAIAFGAKPCGGPWSYLVYSVQTTDSARLAAAVERYNAREDELNRELGRVSDCRMVTAPRLDCVESRCVEVR